MAFFAALVNGAANANINAAALPQAGATPVDTLGRVRKRTREVERMAKEGIHGVDSQDVGQHVLIENAAIVAAGGAAPGAPLWAAPLFAICAQNGAQIATLNAQIASITARQMNGMATNGPDVLQPISNAAGALPGAFFPPTFATLHSMAGEQLVLALRFYNLPVAPAVTRLSRFKNFIGVR